jgi:hypothetical protein
VGGGERGVELAPRGALDSLSFAAARRAFFGNRSL